VHESNETTRVAPGQPIRYVGDMSRFLPRPASRRGITVLTLTLLIIGVVILAVLLSRYVAV
jgi:hypothetical protein